MTFDVKFEMDPMTLNVGFGEIYDVSEGEADRIYQDGYTTGKTEGYESGKQDGYSTGKAEGYQTGYKTGYENGMAESYDTGYADGQAVADSIVDRSISGKYENDRVTYVGDYAFYNCSGVSSVSFPSATSVKIGAFYFCSGLKEVSLPAATYAENSSFRSCNSLTQINLPAATSIGEKAFYTCPQLAKADFAAATRISSNAFYGCNKLTKLILRNPSQVCKLDGTNAFTSTPIKSGKGYIYVPDDLVDSYKTATNWSTYAAHIKPLSELEE